MAGEAFVRFRLSSRHAREDASDWAYVGAGAYEHDNHWWHDDFLQVSDCWLLLEERKLI